MSDILCLSGVELNCHPKTIKNTSVHLFLHYENISTYLDQPRINFNIASPKMAATHQLELVTHTHTHTKGKYITSLPLFFKIIPVLTPSLGQAVNVTVYAWSNKNVVFHQGNRVRQSVAHLQTFKSWNNKRNPPRTDNQKLSHSEHGEDQSSM